MQYLGFLRGANKKATEEGYVSSSKPAALRTLIQGAINQATQISEELHGQHSDEVDLKLGLLLENLAEALLVAK